MNFLNFFLHNLHFTKLGHFALFNRNLYFPFWFIFNILMHNISSKNIIWFQHTGLNIKLILLFNPHNSHIISVTNRQILPQFNNILHILRQTDICFHTSVPSSIDVRQECIINVHIRLSGRRLLPRLFSG